MIVRVDLDHREQRRDGLLEPDAVSELPLDEIADHSLGLGIEDVDRERRHIAACDALESEQPDLRPVAVGHCELVLHHDRREGVAGGSHVMGLPVDAHLLATPQQGMTAERDDDSLRGSALSVHITAVLMTMSAVTMTKMIAR